MNRVDLMVVDVSAVCHAAKHALGKTKLSHDDKPTFVIYGFLHKLLYLYTRLHPKIVVFACDSKTSLRKEVFPAYKEKRSNTSDKTEEERELDRIAIKQFKEIRKSVLPAMGYTNIFLTKGLEGDDVMASLCQSYAHLSIVLVTRDRDMYQLLTPSVSIFDPQTKKLFTSNDFISTFGITPAQWVHVKQIAGCSTDEVPGVKGVKEKTAIKYLLGTLKPHTLAYKAIEESRELAKFNKQLVKLPFKGTPQYQILPYRIKRQDVRDMCTEYGFNSIIEELHVWSEFMNMV